MNEDTPAGQAAGQALEPLPELFTIPAQLIEDWFAIPSHAPLTVDLRRGDLDHFYNSIYRSIEAQYVFQDCMIDFSNGNVTGANVKLRNAQRRLVEAQNALRQFMAAVMASASRPPRA
jgi:hypothetical protein